MDLQETCLQVVHLVKEVGAFIKKEFKEFDRSHVEYKGLNDMVSYVDKQAEKQLVEGLSSIVYNTGFIAEEGTGDKIEGGMNWIIDPLDGTTNFIHGIPAFAISIALMDKDELVLGCVLELNQNECFYAWKDGGAYLDGSRIHVSASDQLKKGLVATGFPYHDFEKMPQYMAILMGMMKGSHGLRRIGSAAVDLAYVACGRFDGFFEYNLRPWDVAGGTIIVKEAGGVVTDFSGGPNSTFGKELLAACPGAHQDMIEIIQKEW